MWEVRILCAVIKKCILQYTFLRLSQVQWFCAKHSCEILLLHKVELSPERKMVEDILSILHCFSARLYGLRKYSSQISKDQSLPTKKSPSSLETVASSK